MLVGGAAPEVAVETDGFGEEDGAEEEEEGTDSVKEWLV